MLFLGRPCFLIGSLAIGGGVVPAAAEPCDHPLFGPPVPAFTADGPRRVIVADLDGDLDQDLVITSTSDAVSVLLNDGDGTLSPPTDYFYSGSFWSSLAQADLDGDGDIDLAASGSSTVTVLLNHGDGSFDTDHNLGVARDIRSMDIGDLDGDLDLDIVVVSRRDDTVTMLLNNGDGTFAPEVSFDGGLDPVSVAVADLDGDLDADLAVGVGSGATISTLLNDGAGTFSLHTSLDPGSTAEAIRLGDLDGDGDPDLAIGGEIALNLGDGTFGTPSDYGPDGVAVMGDLDGDGYVDLAVGAAVLLGAGDGTFAPAGTYETLDASATGDLDGDGDLDLVDLNGAGSNTVVPWFNDGSGSFSGHERVTYEVGLGPTALAAGDLDGDDDVDLAIVDHGDLTPGTFGSLSFLLNDGDGTFAAGIPLPSLGLAGARQAMLCDLDDDGDLDFVAVAAGIDGLAVLLNEGDATFVPVTVYEAGPVPQSMAVGDVDGDLDADIVVASRSAIIGGVHYDAKITIFANAGDGSFDSGTDLYTGINSPGPIAAVDLDGDLDLDLVYVGATVRVRLGNGDGTFSPEIDAGDIWGWSFVIATGDLDGDLDIDLAVLDDDHNTISVFLNRGDASFHSRVVYEAGNWPDALALGDVDGDGDLDLAASGSVLLNAGDGTFGAPVVYNGIGAVVLADLDGDLDLDLAVANVGQASVSVLLNDCVPPPPPCPADIDGSGAVDIMDLLTVIAEWGCVELSDPCLGDVNGDGMVEVIDLLDVLEAWGPCPGD
jgi:hypothetical protein